MATDSNERGAIERVARRIKEQAEKNGDRPKPYEHYQQKAREVAIESDRRKGK